MGKGSSGGTTQVNNSSPPPQVMAQYQNVIDQANSVAKTPYSTGGFNANNLVAPFNGTQNSAFNTINGAQGLAMPYINGAQGLINNSQAPIWGNAQQYGASMNSYMNPYLNQAVGATISNINETNAEQNQQVVGNAISKGAWGGDRASVAQAEMARQQGLAENSTIANMENTGFAQQQQEFNQQQGAQIGANEANSWLASQGAFGLANLGNEAFNTTMTGANTQLQAGNQQQQQTQAGLNIPYEQFLAQQAYPYQNLSWLSSISTGLGSGMGGTSSSTAPSPNTTSQAIGTGLGILGTAAMFLNKGGAVEPRGLSRPIHRDAGGIIPDLSISYIPGAPQMTHGVGIPTPPHATTPQANNTAGQAGSMMGIASKLANHNSPTNNESLKSIASTGFDVANAQANGMGDMVSGFQNPNGTTNISSPVDINGDSVAFGSPDASMMGGLLSSIGFARGGSARHYDDGGAIGGLTPSAAGSNPFTQNQYAQYTNMPTEKLQEIAMRMGNTPQGQLARKALQQKQMMSATAPQPNIQQPTGLMQPGMARGGSAHYDNGGGGGALDDEDSIASPVDLPAVSAPMDAGNAAKMSALYPESANAAPSTPQTAPGLSPASESDMATFGKRFADEQPYNKPDPWASLAKAGFSMAAGRSHYALENIGAGAAAGLEDYSNQKKQAAAESEHRGTLQEQGESLYDRIQNEKANQSRETEALHETERSHQADESLKQKQIDQGKYVATPLGQVLNTKTGEMTGTNPFASGAPATGADGKPLTGEAYKATLDPQSAMNAQKVVDGDFQLTPYMLTKNPMYLKMWNDAQHIDPSVSQQRYSYKQEFLKGNSPDAKNIDVFNTVGGHLQLLEQTAKALDNGDSRTINAVKNTWREQMGSELPTNIGAARTMVAGELVKAVTGAGGVTDREKYEKEFSDRASNGQLMGAVDVTKHLINQRIGSAAYRYKNTVGGDYWNNITPEVRGYLKTPAGAAPDTVRVTGPDGKSTGSIPSARLQDYLANGYKQVQ